MDAATNELNRHGERLLTAVERIVDDHDNLIAYVEGLREQTLLEQGASEAALQRVLAKRIIADYSTKSAFSGAITAMPGIVPGGGTIAAVVGGSLVDMAFMLKHEVEMSLCLTHLYGYDIREERERWLAYVLASVSTYEAKSGRNYFVDLAEAQLEAITKYTPRQLAKMLLGIMGRLALLGTSRGLVKAVPLVGVVVSASANKVLTGTIGWRCVDALMRRRDTDGHPSETIVDATVG